jgi:hypothetical protein
VETPLNFRNVVDDFATTMDALREFIPAVGPVLIERKEKVAQTVTDAIAGFQIAMLITGEDSDTVNMPTESKEKLLEIRKLLSELMETRKLEQLPAEVRRMLPIVFVDGKPQTDWGHPRAPEIIPLKRAFDTVEKQVRLMYETALMAITSRSEWFIAQLLHLFFSAHPEAAGMSEPFFSLDALASLNTIDQARDVLIEHKVESIMRLSLDDWLKFFKEKPKLGLGYLTEVSRIAEIFKRRNLVVHNGGRINRKYLDEIDEGLRTGLKPGDTIEIEPGYLNSSIDLVEHAFVLLAAELWKKLKPTDENRAGLLQDLAVQSLVESRWSLARGFSQFVLQDKNVSEAGRLSSQINYWQSFKWAGQYDEVRNEVESADFSAKSRLYQLAYAAIRDDFERCFKLLPEVIAGGELTQHNLMRWPLFQALRRRSEFATYMEAETKTEDLKSDATKIT